MKKVLSYALSLFMVLSLLMYPSHEVQAANVSLGVSASTVNIGDNVTVSVSVPDGVTATVDLTFPTNVLSFSSSSADVGTNGGTITINVGKMSMAGSNTVSVTFKANSSGTASLSANVVSAVDNNTVEDVSLGGASTTITVANQTTDTGGGATTEPQKSGDNSLSSLKLSSGTLSPSFKYNVTKYTATVGYDVTKVVVSAKTSSDKATIESVTGNGTVNLSVGENTIQVVVKAENGVKATYTIVVTRKAQDTTAEPEPSESTSESETTVENNEVLQWNGEQLQAPATIPTESIPADFESTSIVVNGQQMEGLSFTKGDLKVLYLINSNGAGSLYVYDEAQQMIYPFIKLSSEKSYVMVLVPDEQNAPAPEGFESCTFSIEGKGIINAYQLKDETPAGTEEVEDSTVTWSLFGAETFYAAEAKTSDFYLIYCMNDDGEKGWYMYDSVEETFQRYLAATSSVQASGDVTDSDLQSKYAELEKELNTAKMTQYIIIAIAVAITIILVIVIVVILLKKRSEEEDFFDEYEEDDDEYEEDDVEYDMDDVYVNTLTEEVGDDEIEIEFYNMEELIVNETEQTEKKVSETPIEKTSKYSKTEDDDDDLEFIDFE